MSDTTEAPAVIDRQVDGNADLIIQQRKESQRWLQANYYPEWQEGYRSTKARVEKREKKNAKGEMEEDKSRTNICFSDHFVMVRHGKARLTRNPPNLRMRADNQENGDKMAALLMYQWDKSESQRGFSKIVHAGKQLGWGIGKSYYDKAVVVRQFRKITNKLTQKELMRVNGAPDDEIEDVDEDELPSQGDLSAANAQHGDEVTIPTPITKFQGCVLADVFPGDFFPEPGFRSISESGFNIENSFRDVDWLQYWTKQVTVDPDDPSGAEVPVISKQAAAELLEMAGTRNTLDRLDISLRREMRESIGLSDPNAYNAYVSKGTRKRFLVDERHSIENGRLVIEYVGEESVYLGKQWYPYETYGKYLYTELLLIPDLLGGIGDSTVRISKFLMQMRNNRGNQTNDYINNKMAPLCKILETSNYTDADLIRTSYMRALKVKDFRDLEPLEDPAFPAEAWQEQAAIVREMQQIEPAMSDFAPGTDAVPQSGKLATTAVLQQKSADSITADELNNLNQFVRDTTELWVHINQQAMQDDLTINPGDVQRVDMLTAQFNGGKPCKITISPMDIQEEMQVLPEAGSTLAADDQFRVQSLQQGLQLAMQIPAILNVKYFASELVKAMPGVNADQAIIQNPPPPPPPPPPKVSVNIAVPWPALKPDVQAALLQSEGLPTADTEAIGMIEHGSKAIQHIAAAGHAAADLQSPAQGSAPDDTPTPPGVKAVETKVGD